MNFQREKIRDCISEALPLVRKHYEEIAWNRDKIPLKIDVSKYTSIEDSGLLLCYTARVSARLVGYAVFLVHTHLHYADTTFAVNDIIYIDPAYRGKTGSKFIDWIEVQLKSLGVQTLTYHVKDSMNWGALLQRKGFELVDYIWQKWLQE